MLKILLSRLKVKSQVCLFAGVLCLIALKCTVCRCALIV